MGALLPAPSPLLPQAFTLSLRRKHTGTHSFYLPLLFLFWTSRLHLLIAGITGVVLEMESKASCMPGKHPMDPSNILGRDKCFLFWLSCCVIYYLIDKYPEKTPFSSKKSLQHRTGPQTLLPSPQPQQENDTLPATIPSSSVNRISLHHSFIRFRQSLSL